MLDYPEMAGAPEVLKTELYRTGRLWLPAYDACTPDLDSFDTMLTVTWHIDITDDLFEAQLADVTVEGNAPFSVETLACLKKALPQSFVLGRVSGTTAPLYSGPFTTRLKAKYHPIEILSALPSP